MPHYIYLLHFHSGHGYIGRTTDVEERMRQHRAEDSPVGRAIRAGDLMDPGISILDRKESEEEAAKEEAILIEAYRAGWGKMLNPHLTEKTNL